MQRTVREEKSIRNQVYMEIYSKYVNSYIDRVFISEKLVGADISLFCAECKQWETFREFYTLDRNVLKKKRAPLELL